MEDDLYIAYKDIAQPPNPETMTASLSDVVHHLRLRAEAARAVDPELAELLTNSLRVANRYMKLIKLSADYSAECSQSLLGYARQVKAVVL